MTSAGMQGLILGAHVPSQRWGEGPAQSDLCYFSLACFLNISSPASPPQLGWNSLRKSCAQMFSGSPHRRISVEMGGSWFLGGTRAVSLVELCWLQAAAPSRGLTRISPYVVPQWLMSPRAFPPVLQKALSLAHRCWCFLPLAQLGGGVGVSCAG